MQWNLRDGVILTSVCEQYILVSCSAARRKCPYALRINDSAAFIWRQMEKGLSFEEIKAALYEEYEVTDDTDLGEVIEEFIGALKENGYIVSEGENE